MKTQKDLAMKLVRRLGVIRTRDAVAHGITRATLSRLVEEEKLEQLARGVYGIAGRAWDHSFALAIVAKKVEKGVICLASALAFHEMTTQLPSRVWIAIPRNRTPSRLDYPKLETVTMSATCLAYGVQTHLIEKVKVKITEPAKTVADCFKYRSRIGLDVALEALRAYWSERRGTIDELLKAAEVCRVKNVMRPYLEATLE